MCVLSCRNRCGNTRRFGPNLQTRITCAHNKPDAVGYPNDCRIADCDARGNQCRTDGHGASRYRNTDCNGWRCGPNANSALVADCHGGTSANSCCWTDRSRRRHGAADTHTHTYTHGDTDLGESGLFCGPRNS
jgi:hypothetical protein